MGFVCNLMWMSGMWIQNKNKNMTLTLQWKFQLIKIQFWNYRPYTFCMTVLLQFHVNTVIANMDKYTDSPSDTSVHFYCNKVTGFGPLRKYHQAVKQKCFKKGKYAYKIYTSFVFVRSQKLQKKIVHMFPYCVNF